VWAYCGAKIKFNSYNTVAKYDWLSPPILCMIELSKIISEDIHEILSYRAASLNISLVTNVVVAKLCNFNCSLQLVAMYFEISAAIEGTPLLGLFPENGRKFLYAESKDSNITFIMSG